MVCPRLRRQTCPAMIGEVAAASCCRQHARMDLSHPWWRHVRPSRSRSEDPNARSEQHAAEVPCGRCRGCSAEYLCSSGSANVVALRPRGGRDGVDAKEDEDAEIGLGGSGTSAGLFNRIAGSLVSDSVERALSAVGVEQYLDNAVKYVKRVLLLRPNGVRYSEEGELEAEDRGIFLNSTGECM